MKKLMRRLLAIVAAMTMVMAMGVTAFAATDASITVKRDSSSSTADPTTLSSTYTAYKIFDATYTSNTSSNSQDNKTPTTTADGVAYFIVKNSVWLTTVQNLANDDGTKYFTLTETADGTGYNVTLNTTGGITNNETTAKAIAAGLKAALATEPTGEGTSHPLNDSGISLTINTAKAVEKGYYLIDSSLGDNLILVTTNVDVVEKNTYPGVRKTVAEDDESAQIGKDRTFTLTVTIPDGANKQIVLTDTMTKGLTFKSITDVKATATGVADVDLTANTDYTVSEVSAVTGDTTGKQQFTITFPATTVSTNKGKTITITYTATVNKDAAIAAGTAESGKDSNEVKLDYGNEFTSKPDEVDVTSQSFEVRKYAATDTIKKTQLAGAVFQIKNGNDVVNLIKISDTEYRVADANEVKAANSVKDYTAEGTTVNNNDVVANFKTVAGQNIKITGVDGDVAYSLIEQIAPEGYQLRTDAVSVTPGTTNDLVSEITNAKGSALPSTGGMGTTIFYVLGAALVIGAGVVLVTRRRLSR